MKEIESSDGISGRAERISHILDSRVLAGVQKPGRYTGGEPGCVGPSWEGTAASMLLAFPDAYEVGMSHLGFKILYDIINRRPGWRAERAFSPWPDMERAMRKNGIPLYGLESKAPASDFDAIGITLQYELCYTNVLQLLDLAGLKLKASERQEDDPFIIGGGACASNPEPMAEFFDAFLIGDGEEAIGEIMSVLGRRRAGTVGKQEALRELAAIPGMYVPSLNEPGSLVIRRRVLKDLGSSPAFLSREVMPLIECVHDRAVVEVMRGCERGCRFCQAGYINRPVRERMPEELRKAAVAAVERGGYDEASLLSLSTADYSGITELVDMLAPELACKAAAVSLPSLRIDAFSIELARKVSQHRRTGLTFAPEAGTQRMRDIINKGVSEEDLITAAGAAFEAGWEQIKLYFMIGLPFETLEDIDGIAALTMKVLMLARAKASEKGRDPSRAKVNVSVGTLVPKPHTPFQWLGQERTEVTEAKKSRLKSALRRRDITISFSDPFTSKLEALLARGGRNLSEVIAKAYAFGARFDGWGECVMPGHWFKALEETGLDLDIEASRSFPREESLPWSHIDTGVEVGFLLQELDKAREGSLTEDCRIAGCYACGACGGGIENVIAFPGGADGR